MVSLPHLNAQSTLTWDGTGNNNNNWSTKQNWGSGSPSPVAGDNLIFAGSVRLSNNNDFTAATAFASISFAHGSGAFVLGGNSVTLGAGGLINNNTSVTQTVNLSLQLSANRALTTATGGTTVISVAINGAGGVTIAGGGTMNFNATNGYTGTTSVSSGRLNVNGSTNASSAISVSSGATLGGDGVINGNVTLSNGSFLEVANGGLTDRSLQIAGTLTSSGMLRFRVEGEAAASRDVLTVGSVSLTNSLLSLAFTDATVTNMNVGQSGTFLGNPSGYTGSSVYQILSGSNSGMFSNAAMMTTVVKNALGLTGTQYTFTSAGQLFWIAQNPSANAMYLVAIPEPGVSLLSALSLIGLVLRRRR